MICNLPHIGASSAVHSLGRRVFLRVAASPWTKRSNIGVNRTGLIIFAVFCLPGSAFAACESQTDKLKSGTVAFMCPADEVAQDQPIQPSASANVSVVKKAPEPIPAMPAAPLAVEDPAVEAAGVEPAADTSPAAEPVKARSASAKPGKKATRQSKSKKKVKTASRKSTAAKKGRIIHLEKPSLGRRIVQFFGG